MTTEVNLIRGKKNAHSSEEFSGEWAFLYNGMVPCFFRFAGGIRVCSAGALLGFSEMLSRAQMGGGLFFSV